MSDVDVTIPPRRGTKVCSFCRSWRREGCPTCRNCKEVADQLGQVVPVIPISLYRKPSKLREWLTHYKPSRGDAVAAYSIALQGLVADFVSAWGGAIVADFGPIDFATPVPSTAPSKDSVGELFRPSGRFVAPVREVLKLADGAEPRSGLYRPEWFELKEPVRGKRVMLVDDVYTTGARAQSAASALRAHGAHVALILVIGRRINPEFSPEAAEVWRQQVQVGYDLGGEPYWRPGDWSLDQATS